MDKDKREAHLAKAQEFARQKKAEAEAQERESFGLVFKTMDDAVPATPEEPPDNGNLQCILEAVAEVIAACKRQQGEIDAQRNEIASLRDKVDCYIKTPRDMVESARELSAQTAKTLAAVTELRAASERELQRRSEVLDLPALPLDLN